MCAAQCGEVAEQKAEKASRVWLSPSLSFLAATKWTVPFCHTVLQPWCSAPVCRTLWNSEPKSVLPSLSCFCQEVQAFNGYLSTLKGPEWPKRFHTSLYAPNALFQGTYKPMYRFWEVIRTLVHCVLSIYCSPLSELSRGAERRFRFIQPQHIVSAAFPSIWSRGDRSCRPEHLKALALHLWRGADCKLSPANMICIWAASS